MGGWGSHFRLQNPSTDSFTSFILRDFPPYSPRDNCFGIHKCLRSRGTTWGDDNGVICSKSLNLPFGTQWDVVTPHLSFQQDLLSRLATLPATHFVALLQPGPLRPCGNPVGQRSRLGFGNHPIPAFRDFGSCLIIHSIFKVGYGLCKNRRIRIFTWARALKTCDDPDAIDNCH